MRQYNSHPDCRATAQRASAGTEVWPTCQLTLHQRQEALHCKTRASQCGKSPVVTRLVSARLGSGRSETAPRDAKPRAGAVGLAFLARAVRPAAELLRPLRKGDPARIRAIKGRSQAIAVSGKEAAQMKHSRLNTSWSLSASLHLPV